MKIAELLKEERKARLSPLKAKVLSYLEGHPDEVFRSDETLAVALKEKPPALAFTLWALHKHGLIDKERVKGRTYFGCHKAIEHLRQQRPSQRGPRKQASSPDPLAQAQAVRERIRARVGLVDGLSLLEASRRRRE